MHTFFSSSRSRSRSWSRRASRVSLRSSPRRRNARRAAEALRAPEGHHPFEARSPVSPQVRRAFLGLGLALRGLFLAPRQSCPIALPDFASSRTLLRLELLARRALLLPPLQPGARTTPSRRPSREHARRRARRRSSSPGRSQNRTCVSFRPRLYIFCHRIGAAPRRRTPRPSCSLSLQGRRGPALGVVSCSGGGANPRKAWMRWAVSFRTSRWRSCFVGQP